MSITWGDIKLRTLQKMFATNNGSTTIPTDNSTREYISAMPGAANEALQLLATAGKFIIKSIDIAHIPVRNLIPNGENIKSVEKGIIRYEAENVHSMYYEVKGKGIKRVFIGDTIVETPFDSKENGSIGFTAYKELINNIDDLKVAVEFESPYPLSLKNVAMYSATYETDEEIPSNSEYIRYDLSKLVPDFYMVDMEELIYEGDANVSRYSAISDFFQEGFKVLVLPKDVPGNYKVHYKAYPQNLTNESPDDLELAIDPEIAAIMPLYMASQLYKDDDSGIATVYRNEFEVAFERLVQSVKAPSSEHFKSISGWI